MLASTAGFNSDKLETMVEMESNITEHYIPLSKDALSEISWLTFFINIIDILQIAIQTFILILAESNQGNRIAWRVGGKRKKHWFKEILWYLCVCNFSKWVTDSFIEGHFLQISEAKDLVFGAKVWTAITQSAYPLVLFYRFHSVHMIIGVIGVIF